MSTPYAIVAGSPAVVRRMRFPDDLVDRFLKSQWWRYDLNGAVHYRIVTDWDDPMRTLDEIEAAVETGRLKPMVVEGGTIIRRGEQLRHEGGLPPLFQSGH